MIGQVESRAVDALKSRVTLIRGESERFVQYVNGLPQDALNHPSACTRWEVGGDC